MSSYENYESVSKFYDDQREAIGSDVIAGMMQFYCGKPLKVSTPIGTKRSPLTNLSTATGIKRSLLLN